MELSDWITLAAVVVALGIGTSSLVQTQKLQKRERRDRLLNEVIEWAVGVATCEYSVSIEKPSLIFTKLYDKDARAYDIKDKAKLARGIMQDHKRVWQSRYMNLHRNYQTLDARGEYILSLSSTKEFESIHNTIKNLTVQICDYSEILLEYIKDIENESQQKIVDTSAKAIHKSAVQLIRGAVKTKTKDIS